MPKVPKKVKQKSHRQLEKQLKRVFSEYIRLRDSNEHGYVQCITCPKVYHWRRIHAGHFVPSVKSATRYHEKNVHGQCAWCNSFLEGQQYLYAKRIDERYGEGTAEFLICVGRTSVKRTRTDLITMIE